MGRKFLLNGIALCLLLAVGVSTDASCRKGCPQSDNGILQYVPGNVYDYNFDSIMTIAVNSGANADDTTLKITGIAKLFSEGNCGYTLQLGGVKVIATKEAVEKKIASSIQKPIHFTMVNGKLEPELCVDANDNMYSLNIKRAIVSMLQLGNNDAQETDIFGICPTHTSSSKVGNAEVVTKIRNLNNCAYRESITNGIVSGIVNENAGIKSTMNLNADYSKESKVVGGLIENVYVVEEYKYDNAPKEKSDVRAKVITTLKLKSSAGKAANAPATGSRSASIIFQKPDTYTSKNIAALKAAISDLIQLNEEYVHVDSAKGFVDLIRLMRNSDTETLLELSAVPHPNKVLARKIYIDALLRTRTSEAAKAIMKQMNKMDEKEKVLAILSLNTVQEVDKDVVAQAANLLSPNAPKEVYLAIGNIVSRFCERNGCEENEVELISKKFIDNLKHCKANTKKDEERIVYVLKGIANTHHLAKNVATSLTECAAVGRSNRIRVAALQAFSAASCEPALKQKAMDLLRDQNEDSELRIEAYLAAIKCPTAEMANEISEIVNNENVNQVGGFIKSNLISIRDSTDQSRSAQRYYLGNIRVSKSFPKDFRRFSFNNELSYKLEALGLSASSDYNLIYSQHGFLPRSARLNVSTEIYGTNFNIFEASIRQENIENVLEYYIGPKGLLNQDAEEIIKVFQMDDPKAGGRARRSVADDANKISKKYKTYGSKNSDDLNLDLSLKLFGSEIMFLSLGDNVPSSFDEIIQQFSSIFESTKQQLASFSREFRMHNLLMDVDFTYPTAIGIPFELSAQAFSAAKLDFAINIDVDAMLQQNWQSANYRLKIVPSVNVMATIKAGFNAYALSTGVRVQSSLQSATGSDLKVDIINNGNGFNLDIKLPREKMELINVQVQADFYLSEQDKAIKSTQFKGSKKQKSEDASMCFNQLESLGIMVCFESKFFGKDKSDPLDDFLISPLGFNLYMTSEENINIKGNHIPQTPNGAQQWKLDYSTPGSKVSHDTTLAFELGVTPRTYGRLSFDNPQFQFGLEAGLTNDNTEMVVYGQYEQNGVVNKSKVGFTKNGNEYRPIIEVQSAQGTTNNINGYRADGKVVVQKTGEKTAKYTFENFQLIDSDNEKIILNGWADVGPTSLKTELRVAAGQQAFNINSAFKIENSEYEVSLFVNDEKTPENVIGGSVYVQVDQEKINVNLDGKAMSWEIASLTGVQYTRTEGSNLLTSSKFSSELALKHKNTQIGALKVAGSTEGQNKLDVAAEIYRDKKLGSLTVKFANKQKSQYDYIVEINGQINKHFLDIMAKCDFNGNHFLVDNAITTSWGTSVTVKGELGQRYTMQDVFVDLQGAAQLNNKDKPTQWTLKITGAPEKTNSEFKLSRDNTDLVKYVGETQHPQDKITNSKATLIVKNVLTAKGDFKMAKNGKGEVSITVDTLKTEPKHKIELNSKFTAQAPKYDVETTITLDTDHKFYLKTENLMEKNKFSTKNVAECDNKKVSFNANGSVKGEWKLNGEIQGSFTFTCPEGRVIDGNMKRKVTTNPKTGIAQGSMEVQLNDKLASGEKRSVDMSGTLEKLNTKSKDVSISSHLSYTDFEQKKFDLKYHLKHLPKGQNKMIDFGTMVAGDLISQPIELSVVVSEFNKQHAIGRTSVKYGDNLSVSIDGNYKIGERGTPSTYTVQGNIQAPLTNFKSIDMQSNGKLLRPTSEEGGPMIIEVRVDDKLGNGEFLKFNGVYKGSQKLGEFNVDVETKQMKGPLKLGGSFERDISGSITDENAVSKQKYIADFSYDSNFVKSTADINYSDSANGKIELTLDSSFDSAKDINIVILGPNLKEESATVIVEAKQGNKVYSIDSKIFRGSHKKGMNLNVGLPDAKPIFVIGEFEILGDRKAKLTMQIDNVIDLDFKADAEAAYKGVDDFYVSAHWNSQKLNLNNFELDVRSQGKAVSLNLKNAEETIFSGEATVALRTEKNKATLEGQGQLQYKGKTQSSNFRLIRQIFEQSSDKEFGFSYTFNGNFGPKNSVSTFKFTNRDFNVKLSVCEEKKQCTNVQLQSIVETNDEDASMMQHSILVLLDLRELGYPYEFEFQSKTIRQALKFQYSLDSSIISNKNMKYQLVASVMPTDSKVQLKLPNREILLEAKHKYPTQGKIFGHYENSATFYIDKVNKPNDFMNLGAECDISGVENSILNAKIVLNVKHPAIRPLTISGQFDANREQRTINSEIVFDIFRLPEQKIIASSLVRNIQNTNGFNITTHQGIQSAGLGFQYEINGHTALNTANQEFTMGTDLSCNNNMKASAFVYGNKEKFEVVSYVLNEPVLQMTGELNRQKYSYKFDTKVKLVGQKPIEMTTVIQPSMAKMTVKRADMFTAISEIKLGKEIKCSLDGNGKKLFDGRIGLDSASFLQTTYKSNEENFNEFLNTMNEEIKKESTESKEKIKARFQKLQEEIDKQVQMSKDSIPDFSKLREQYQMNMNEIIKELESDPSFKQLSDAYRQLYTKIVNIMDDYAKIISSSYEQMQASIQTLWNNLLNVLKETLVPAWEEFSVALTKLLGEIRTEVINLYTKSFQTMISVLEKYGQALKSYGKTFNESVKPYNEAAQEIIKFVTSGLEEIMTEIKEWLTKLPTFDAISAEFKQKLNKLKIVEKTIEFINIIFDQLHILPTTPETYNLLQKIQDYLIAKLKQEKVNDEALIEELVNLFNKAMRSIISSIEMSLPNSLAGAYTEGFTTIFTALPSPLEVLAHLPSLATFRLSVINFLLNEKWENIFSKDHLNSWVFFKDFELKGHLIDGRHVFSFDGQHISFSGSCKYILAQDSVNNNFTVIAQLNNGKLKSIFLTDIDGSYMEISDAGALKLNGAAVEYPQHKDSMHAWRKYYTVWMHSEYGVSVMCTTDMKMCHVTIDGFYTSKTRGLFGNGNAEPYDDYIQIDGTIAPDTSAFVNGYAIGKCAPIAADQLENKRTDLCNDMFGIESPLSIGYLFVDAKQYRDACDSAVSMAAEKDKEAVACTYATAYGSALKLDHILAVLPLRCLKCQGGAGQRELGQEFNVKIPNNKADVVFVVDLNVEPTVLRNLVAPAITDLRESLKTRGFTDVQIGVIAYNESQRYPALLTTDNGKINYNGNIADVVLTGPNNLCENCFGHAVNDKLLFDLYELTEIIVKRILPQSDEKAYQLALNYPFRAGAAKSIVAVRSKGMDYDNMLKFMGMQFASAISQFDSPQLHLIAPVYELALEGVPTEKLIGFNSRLVATIDGKDNKKRAKLQFDSNVAIDSVLDNGGWVFASQSFENMKPQEQKKALNQVTNSIADTLFKTEIMADCKCMPVHGLHAQHKCSTKSSTFVPNKKIKSA